MPMTPSLRIVAIVGISLWRIFVVTRNITRVAILSSDASYAKHGIDPSTTVEGIKSTVVTSKNLAQQDRTLPSPSFSKNATSKSSTCRRPCPPGRRKNKIVYNNWETAGLNDKATVLWQLTNLAEWLCAKVVFPPPYRALDQKHNHLQPSPQQLLFNNTAKQQPKVLSRELQWIDLINVTRLDETRGSLVTLGVLEGGVNLEHKDKQYKGWDQVITNHVNDVGRDVERLNDLVQRQHQHFYTKNINTKKSKPKHFIWRIQTNWYFMKAPLLKWMNETTAVRVSLPRIHYKRPGCEYVQLKQPLYLQELVDTVVQQLSSPRASIGNNEMMKGVTSANINSETQASNAYRKDLLGFFHIRRGDARGQCNTELDRIQRYIDCSFSGIDPTGIAPRNVHITLYFASDEEHFEYRNAIRTMVLRQQDVYSKDTNNYSFRLSIDFVDLESILWQLVNQRIQDGRLPSRLANNYVIYKLVKMLSWRADFRLEQRRGIHCRDCDNGWIQSLLVDTKH
jgi:hypothetical protein